MSKVTELIRRRCGKPRKPEAVLPAHAGAEPCPTCWVPPGQMHELSCERVTPEQFDAFLAAQGGAQ